jgi:hypothetical protein
VGKFKRQRVCVYRGLSFFARPEGVIPRRRGLDGDYRVPPSLQGGEKFREKVRESKKRLCFVWLKWPFYPVLGIVL